MDKAGQVNYRNADIHDPSRPTHSDTYDGQREARLDEGKRDLHTAVRGEVPRADEGRGKIRDEISGLEDGRLQGDTGKQHDPPGEEEVVIPPNRPGVRKPAVKTERCEDGGYGEHDPDSRDHRRGHARITRGKRIDGGEVGWIHEARVGESWVSCAARRGGIGRHWDGGVWFSREEVRMERADEKEVRYAADGGLELGWV